MQSILFVLLQLERKKKIDEDLLRRARFSAGLIVSFSKTIIQSYSEVRLPFEVYTEKWNLKEKIQAWGEIGALRFTNRFEIKDEIEMDIDPYIIYWVLSSLDCDELANQREKIKISGDTKRLIIETPIGLGRTAEKIVLSLKTHGREISIREVSL